MMTKTLPLLEMLVAHDTTNPPRHIDTGGIIRDIGTLASDAGCSVKVEDLGDGAVILLAVRGTPDTLFNVHLDTVPTGDGWTSDPLTLRVTDDRAYGRGACDIKGAAACLLTAGRPGRLYHDPCLPYHLGLLERCF